VDENDPTGECTSSIMADTEGDDGPQQWLVRVNRTVLVFVLMLTLFMS
jgi:hypothetical protein